LSLYGSLVANIFLQYIERFFSLGFVEELYAVLC